MALEVDEDLAVRADPDKIARVFANILKNAAAYSYPHTGIRIKRKDLLRDRKPKTCPARIRHAGGIQPIEFIKQQRQLFRRDRFSLILKREQDIRVRLFGKNAYPGMRITVGRRIFQDIGKSFDISDRLSESAGRRSGYAGSAEGEACAYNAGKGEPPGRDDK